MISVNLNQGMSLTRWISVLLFNIYFERHQHGHRLARELGSAVDADATTNSRGTLFSLDGLDEVSELLDSGHTASSFLTELMNSPNVIITTRPHTSD